MATVEAVAPPWEGALAYKIDRTDGSGEDPYAITIDGPWDEEPDKIQWVDPATDLDCLMVRNRMGNWCGYVGVPAGHPAYRADYMDLDVSVHGGLTYGDVCMASDGPEDQPSAGICHVPFEGRPHDVYWLGFDCGHAFDFAPGMYSMERKVMPDLLSKFGKDKSYDHEAAMASGDWTTERYRTMAYVRAEVTDLASQLSRLPITKG